MTGSTTREVDTPHGPVPLDIRVPLGSALNVGVLLAHGAGAGRTHPWIIGLADALAGGGFTVFTFDYAYMAAGRKAPDRLPKLLDVHEAVAGVAAEHADRLVVAGKSMGGRVGGHLVADGRADPIAVAYLGYPLVAIGKTVPRSTEHLLGIDVSQLFVSGDRDPMGPRTMIEDVADSVSDGRVIIVEHGDHSLVPLKRSGATLDDSFAIVVASMRDVVGRPG
jgi:predicted alpha/beta-hydrolase family hydrolase